VRWHDALKAVLDRAAADPGITGLLGGEHIYQLADVRAVRIPSLTYSVLYLSEAEVFEPFGLQWGCFARTEDVHALQAAARRVLTSDHQVEVGGMQLFMLFEGGRVHEQPAPGVQHHSFDVRYEPLRSRYYQRVP
jgi:hypothetical protein